MTLSINSRLRVAAATLYFAPLVIASNAVAHPVGEVQTLPAQRVTIDPVTKQIRPTEHNDIDRESDQSKAAIKSRRVAPSPEQVVRSMLPSAGHRIDRPNGAIGRIVDASLLSYSVVRIRPDGTRDESCVVGADEANAFVSESAPLARTNGASNDR